MTVMVAVVRLSLRAAVGASVLAFMLTGCLVEGKSSSPSTVTVHETGAPSSGGYRSPASSAVPAGPATSIPSDGTYIVGTDIAPGTYHNPGGSECYWARLRSLDTSDIIDNNNSNGPQAVEVKPSDKAFLTHGCQTWSLISAARSAPTVGAAPSATQNLLPDADSQGFVNYQGSARCGGTDPAALIVRTAQSAAVICQSGPASFYYRGLRLSDGGNMQLTGATPTQSGFSVINPSDGTEYDVSHSGLVIHWNGKVYTESAIESAP